MGYIGVIGEGSWGTAMVKILQENGHVVHWLVRDKKMRTHILKNFHNPYYSSDIELDIQRLKLYDSVKSLVELCDLHFFILPSVYSEVVLQQIAGLNLINKKFFSATKGILPDSQLTVCQYLEQHLNVPINNIGFISGPSHAEEIARERLTYLTVLSKNKDLALEVSSIIANRFIKTKIGGDVYGAEYATAMKNIMAIAAGIIHGLGYGDNFTAVFVSNAIKEIQKFINTLYPYQRDITEYVYLGDLLVTCYSQYSRNRTFGIMIGKGYSVKAAQLEMNMVAEGYYAVKPIIQIAEKNNIDLPICKTIYHILYERYSPIVEMRLLTEKLI